MPTVLNLMKLMLNMGLDEAAKKICAYSPSSMIIVSTSAGDGKSETAGALIDGKPHRDKLIRRDSGPEAGG